MNAQIRITYRDTDGNIIENPTKGQRAFSPETKKLYVYTDEGWQQLDGDINLGMSMYDLNKQVISQLPYLDKDGLEKAVQTLDNYAQVTEHTYYMLLCRDINYYTLFYVYSGLVVPSDLNHFSADVLECATNIGAIKSVEQSEGAIEIWVQPTNEEPMAMYLFGYDTGVIECIL